MANKVAVIFEKDEHGYYVYSPGLPGCQSQGATFEEALSNIREAVELYVETLSPEERKLYLSKEILTTAVEVGIA